MKKEHPKMIRVPQIFKKAIFAEKSKNPDSTVNEILTKWGNEKLNNDKKKQPTFPRW